MDSGVICLIRAVGIVAISLLFYRSRLFRQSANVAFGPGEPLLIRRMSTPMGRDSVFENKMALC